MPSLALCVPGHNLGVFYTSKGTKTPLLMFLNIYYFQNKYNFQNIYFFKYVKCITLYLFIKLIKLFFSGTTRDWLTRGLCVSASQMVFMYMLGSHSMYANLVIWADSVSLVQFVGTFCHENCLPYTVCFGFVLGSNIFVRVRPAA